MTYIIPNYEGMIALLDRVILALETTITIARMILPVTLIVLAISAIASAASFAFGNIILGISLAITAIGALLLAIGIYRTSQRHKKEHEVYYRLKAKRQYGKQWPKSEAASAATAG